MPFEFSPEGGVCSTCRRPLTRRGAEGECLRCLFGLGFSPDDDPGDWQEELPRSYGHFEISLAADATLEELGRGAMGVTYRARDTVLNVSVALKLIGRDFASHPGARARFLREARAAARLRHPNVASVFHYGEQGGQCFYAMELVEGETLEARVRRDGPFPAGTALEIAEQVTRALAAAEAQGVVHRDLKPGNIMLAADPAAPAGETPTLVKVIDFGLAKSVMAGAESPGLADTRGGFVGTPAFASPEQHGAGENERVDTRSDIYSLGVTLWYLLCGKLPFVGGALDEIREQQTRLPLPLHQLQNAKAPASAVTLLKSMLAVSPAARPQSARELLGVLGQCRRQLSAPPWTKPSWQWVGWLAVLAILVGTGFAVSHWQSRPPKPILPPELSVAVLPFENHSPEQNLAFFADGLYQETATGLARIAELKVVGTESARGYPPGGRDLARIGRELGVNYLLEGSVERRGDQGHISVKLSDARGAADAWTKQYDLRLAEVAAVQREIARDVALRLGAKLSPDEQTTLNERPTADPVAYDLFLRSGEGLHQFDSPAKPTSSARLRPDRRSTTGRWPRPLWKKHAD